MNLCESGDSSTREVEKTMKNLVNNSIQSEFDVINIEI
jgi:hypothetical protein